MMIMFTITEHAASINVTGDILWMVLIAISIMIRRVISDPRIKNRWIAFVALAAGNAFLHALSTTFLFVNDDVAYTLMNGITYFFDSVFAVLLITGFFFVVRESWRNYDKVDEAYKVKSAFMHSMSHELRTPLNGIIGNADMLANGMLGMLTAEQGSAVNDIISSSNDLLRMTDIILENASMTSDHFDIRKFVIKDDCGAYKSIVSRMSEKLRETGHADFVIEVMKDVPINVNLAAGNIAVT